MKRIGAALLALGLAATPALAGQGGDILRDSLYAGTLDAGEAQLRALDATDQEAKFGLGVLEVMHSLQGLVQALYKHGLTAPQTGPLGPILGIPMPPNANPEPLDYDKFRVELEAFVNGLDTARATLTAAGDSGDYVVLIDPFKIRMDVNGDGQSDSNETVAAVVALAFGEPTPAEKPDTTTGGASMDRPSPGIGLDRADAIWLAGYADVFAMQADFLLAHDFREFFDATFHRFFPRAGLIMQQYARGGQLMLDPETDASIADLIAGIHTLDWPVAEPDRLKRVRARAHEITAYSRRNWDAILAETDDDHELLPSPTQTAMGGGDPITADKVAAWLKTLDAVDQVLDGKLLLPHWRFRQGFDLKAYFETATETDFVMLLTGLGALPYLKDGPIATAETFADANRAFGGDLIGYALWFN